MTTYDLHVLALMLADLTTTAHAIRDFIDERIATEPPDDPGPMLPMPMPGAERERIYQ